MATSETRLSNKPMSHRSARTYRKRSVLKTYVVVPAASSSVINGDAVTSAINSFSSYIFRSR